MVMAPSGQAARQQPQEMQLVTPGATVASHGMPAFHFMGPGSLLMDRAGQIKEQMPHRLQVSSLKARCGWAAKPACGAAAMVVFTPAA